MLSRYNIVICIIYVTSLKIFFCIFDILCYFCQISDDEDDTHPNIDTPSLFRWRHQARLERMEERRKEQEEHEKKKTEYGKMLY